MVILFLISYERLFLLHVSINNKFSRIFKYLLYILGVHNNDWGLNCNYCYLRVGKGDLRLGNFLTDFKITDLAQGDNSICKIDSK